MLQNTQLKLSNQEVDQFLEKINQGKYVEGQCRLQYLEQIMEKTQELLPFQNVFLLTIPQLERRSLSYQEVKQLMIQGNGGFCLVQNPFFCGLLQNLGYEAQLIHASCRKIPENHVCIIVQNIIEQGDMYLVDVSIGFKNMPLKLDFDNRSEVQNWSFGQCYFEWQDQNKKVLNRIDDKNQFFSTYYIEEVFSDYEDILKYSGDVYTNINKSPFHKSLRIVRFPSSGAICIKDKELLVEDITTRKLNVKEKITDVNQYLKFIEQYFPMLDKDECKQAYNTLFGSNEDKSN